MKSAETPPSPKLERKSFIASVLSRKWPLEFDIDWDVNELVFLTVGRTNRKSKMSEPRASQTRSVRESLTYGLNSIPDLFADEEHDAAAIHVRCKDDSNIRGL